MDRQQPGPEIIIGIVLGAILATVSPATGTSVSMLGQFFVAALKAVAPILIFILVISSIANQKPGQQTHMRPIILLYFVGTLTAATVAVTLSFASPAELALVAEGATNAAPQGIGEVLKTLLFKVVDNPVNALLTANYIGILAWGIGLGLLLRKVGDNTKTTLHDLSDAVTGIVQFVIQLAPMAYSDWLRVRLRKPGVEALLGYTHLLVLLVGAMLIVALIINPIIVYVLTRENPFPLVLRCLEESGITAFFTRSSAANIPVNLLFVKSWNWMKTLIRCRYPLGRPSIWQALLLPSRS